MLNFLKKQDINQGVAQFKAASGAVLLDVRTAEEYRGGHVPGSVNVDVDRIGEAALLIPSKSTPIFVYCYSGARSSAATDALKSMGYLDVINIGGIRSYTGPAEKGV